MKNVSIDGKHLSVNKLMRVAVKKAGLSLAKSVVQRIGRARAVVEKVIESGVVKYGINTGFGKLSELIITGDQMDQLQENLILSHASGVGSPLPEEIVRAIMVLKVHNLAAGYSGCRLEVVKTLVDMINAGVHPIIPEKGSVGASGDLAPLAHMALVMIGEGRAMYKGVELPGLLAMKEAGIPPLKLKAKDGIVLLNGTQVMTAIACFALTRAENLFDTADVAGAMTFEALLGSREALDPRIHRVRGFSGQIRVAQNLSKMLAESDILESQKYQARVQDAYCLRCMPQVHGASRDSLDHVRRVVETEVNAVTDNPLVFSKEEEILSGGNFHGQPIALVMDLLAIAAAEIADISERRIEHLLDPHISGLAGFLTEEGGVNSGFMMAQVTAASLVSENKVLAHPASVDSIPTSANKEDHVSMGTLAARKALEIIDNAETVIAIELLCAAQALDLRIPYFPGTGTRKALGIIRGKISHLKKDRIIHPDIAKAKEIVTSGKLAKLVAGD